MIDRGPQPTIEGRASGRRFATIMSGALIIAGGIGVAVAKDASSEKDTAPVGWSPVEQDRFTSCFRETGEWILGATYESDFPHDKRMDIEIISAPGAIETVDDDDAEGGQDVTATAFAKFPSDQGSAVIEFAFTYPGSPGEVDKKTITGNKPVEKCPGGETTTTTTNPDGSTTTTTTTTTTNPEGTTTTTIEVTTTTSPNGSTTTTTTEATTTTNPNGSTTTTSTTTTTEPSGTTTTIESTTTTLPDGTTTTIATTTTTLPNGTTTTSTTIGGPVTG